MMKIDQKYDGLCWWLMKYDLWNMKIMMKIDDISQNDCFFSMVNDG